MLKKYVAIIAVKKNSRRLKNKNLLKFKKKPLFLITISPLLKLRDKIDIFISTNSEEVKSICNKENIPIIWRGPNKSEPNEPLIDVLKYSYSSLNHKYKYLITILANSPGHKKDQILKSLKLIEKNNYHEIRSFNSSGEESGLMIFNVTELLKKKDISSYIGMVKSECFEIHYEKDWIRYKSSRFKA